MAPAKRNLMSLLVVMLLIIVGHPLTVKAISLEFYPASQSVDLGTNAQVDVWLRSPGDKLLSTYDFLLSYDPAILAYGSTSFSNALGNPSSDPNNVFRTDLITAGSLEIIAFPLIFDPAIQNGTSDLLLFSLNFSTLAAGTSTLNFLTDPYLYLGDENGDPLQADIVSGSIVVNQTTNPVPEPNTILLLIAGLIGVFYRKRKSIL